MSVCARCGSDQRPFAAVRDVILCAGEGDQEPCCMLAMADGALLADGRVWAGEDGWQEPPE